MALPPPPPGLEDWSSARCAGCHEDQAAALELSGHADARFGVVFRAALEGEEPALCVRCHAPLAADATRGRPTPGAALEERGIPCAACHAAPGGVRARRSSGDARHGVVVDPDLGGASCGGCHAFGFPLGPAPFAPRTLSLHDPQQDTDAEWRAWRAASGDPRDCLDCHGGGDHAFGGRRRIEALARAISVTAAPGALLVGNREAGHRLPTGDVMRALSIEVASEPLFEAPIVLRRFDRTLGLVPARADEPAHAGGVADDRLPHAGGGVVEITLPTTDPPLRYGRVVYHLLSLDQERRELLPKAASRVVLQTFSLGETP